VWCLTDWPHESATQLTTMAPEPQCTGQPQATDTRDSSAASTTQLGKIGTGSLDLRRMAQIALAKPTDHAGEVAILPQRNFDISKTIFGSVDSALRRYLISDKVDNLVEVLPARTF